MGDFLQMAKRGSVFLFGDGEYLLNPIHGEDLAKVIVEAIDQNKREINVGGPDILSQNEIATLALKAYAKPIKIVHLPLFLQRLILWILRTFTTSKIYGPLEFFLSTMVMNMVGPQYGINSLEDFFTEQISKE
jgi:nucleoside-diphosphate-sugar epimerase